MGKLRIRKKVPWIGYPGSYMQNTYGEGTTHGYLLWDIDDRQLGVEFHELPNVKPYVTLEWKGTVATTLELASSYPQGSRFRIDSQAQLSHKDVINISKAMHSKLQASEVTFRSRGSIVSDVVSTGTSTFAKTDLRNFDVLTKMLKEYHSDATITDDEWKETCDLVKFELSKMPEGDVLRNAKWSIRHFKFDNTFAYGEGNVINFDNLNGIVGVFGQNRSGKSSLVGSIMYALFNDTDRGTIKNVHVVNARKPFCYTRCIVTVDGNDYVIERQTVKTESKKGVTYANTSLNVFKMVNNEAVDLVGEQRYDTEKVIRRLLGSSDDFMLTSLAAQGELNTFIKSRSTNRRQVIARFLDIDVFKQLHDLTKNDLNVLKGSLRTFSNVDWNEMIVDCTKKIQQSLKGIEEHDVGHARLTKSLHELQRQYAVHSSVKPVTSTQVIQQRKVVDDIRRRVESTKKIVDGIEKNVSELQSTVTSRESQLCSSLDALKKKIETIVQLELTVTTLKHTLEKEQMLLLNQRRTLSVLDNVPCGDSYPTCMYIKDAYLVKETIVAQEDRVLSASTSLNDVVQLLEGMEPTRTRDEYRAAQDLERLKANLVSLGQDLNIKMMTLDSLVQQQSSAGAILIELERALSDVENERVSLLKKQIDDVTSSLKKLDAERLDLAKSLGSAQALKERYTNEQQRYEILLRQFKVHELVVQAFSKKAIPSRVVSSQLPIINAEVAEILRGIVEFVVELELDDESDALDVYINYGDSRRIIELGSGMEKMIASIAIRVALTNVSSLPKTDFFIVDEGFSALDESSIEACNRLLVSLKRFFKTIIVMTHVDGVKDAADTIIEIVKNEKDAGIMYE